MTSILRLLCVVCVILVGLNKLFAANVILSWAPASSSAAAGYYVYFGTTAGNYAYRLNAGNATSITISNLFVASTNYFAVSAYDSAGHESTRSSAIKYVIPYLLKMHPRSGLLAPAVLQFEAAPLHWYEIQTSANMRNWNTVWQSALLTLYTVTGFTDYNVAGSSSRFYRLVVH